MAAGIRSDPIYRFGLYEADAGRDTLSRNGTPVKLQDQPFRVLILLLERSGSTVTRDELRRLIWGEETHVDFDANLNAILKKLRAALRDDPDNPTFIETVPRHGYRFIAPVSIAGATGSHSQSTQAETPAPEASIAARRNWRRAAEWALVAAVSGLITIAMLSWTRKPASPALLRSYILPPNHATFVTTGPALSPDGRLLAFIATLPNGGAPLLWVESLDSLSAKPLGKTENAVLPFWSPDSRRLGFFANGKLSIVEAEGGPPQALCDAPLGRGGAWNQDGVILFAPDLNGPLQQVPATGGTPKIALAIDAAPSSMHAWWPQFLPDGKHFIYWSSGIAAGETDGVYLGKLGSKERLFLIATESDAVYADGNLLYAHEQTLLTRRFDPDRLRFEGEPAEVAERVGLHGGMHYAEFTASQTGLLSYFTGTANKGWPMILYGRDGKPQGRVVPQRDIFLHPRFSPDGKQIAVAIERSGSGMSDVWTIDLQSGTRKRITFDQHNASDPVWSADGKLIYYSSSMGTGDLPHIYARFASGAGTEQAVLATPDISEIPMDVSKDGAQLIYARRENGKNWGIWILPLRGAVKPSPFVQSSRFNATEASFSPDGKWVAYVSDETGASEVYIAAHRGEGKWQVSSHGGTSPAWSPESKRLYYVDAAENIMQVEVRERDGAIEPVTPVTFAQNATFSMRRPIAVAPDGRVLIDGHNDEPSPFPAMVLVSNWPQCCRPGSTVLPTKPHE